VRLRIAYLVLLLLAVGLLGGYLCALGQDQRAPWPPRPVAPPADKPPSQAVLPPKETPEGSKRSPTPKPAPPPSGIRPVQASGPDLEVSVLPPSAEKIRSPEPPPAPLPLMVDPSDAVPVPAPPMTGGPVQRTGQTAAADVPLPQAPDLQAPPLPGLTPPGVPHNPVPEKPPPFYVLPRFRRAPEPPAEVPTGTLSLRPQAPQGPEVPQTRVPVATTAPGRAEATADANLLTLPERHEATSSPTIRIDDAASPLRTPIVEVPLNLTVVGPAGVKLGQPAVFDVQVTNTGKQRMGGLILFSKLPPGLKHPMGDQIEADVGELPPSLSKTFQLSTRAVQSGRHVAHVKIILENGQEVSAEGTVTVSDGGLLLRCTGSSQMLLRRDSELRLEVTNLQDRPLRNLAVVDTLPENLEYQTASDRGMYRSSTRTVHWLIDALAPGKTKILGVKVRAKSPGQYTHEAEARSEDGKLTAKATGTLTAEGVPDLVLKVVDRDDPVEAGKETVYEVRVHNQGSMAATKVQVLATLPDGLRLTRVEGPVAYRVQRQQILFNPLPRLNPQAQSVFRISVLAQSPGERRVRVQVTSDQVRVPITHEERTKVYQD
jgi:hypothetical protein